MNVPAPINRFKQHLAAGETQFGIWMPMASPIASEALSLVGYDWMMFDTEHAPVENAENFIKLHKAQLASDRT
jgi:4-hydroxy-2-oxoheptanedioate aldolase